MKTVALGVFFAFVLTGTGAFAQTGTGKGMDQGRMMMKYDPSTEVTVKGTVEEVQETSKHMSQGGKMSQGGMMGTHLLLKTQAGTLTVIVGPPALPRTRALALRKVTRSR